MLANRRDNCFFIDKLPLAVKREAAYKFDQIDLLYQDVLVETESQKEFERIEKKYVGVVAKCWLYNKTYIFLIQMILTLFGVKM